MKIVIIDDVQFNITLLQHLIKKLRDNEEFPNVEAISFTEPLKALAWCMDNEPDLVIVDYMMPEMDGIMFSKRFREIRGYKDIPLLMVTANHEASVRIDALANGVTDFLNKPLDNAEFLARAKNMLRLRKSLKHLAEEVRKATAKIVERERETIFCLARAAEYRDPETGSHIHRMAHYSRHIAACLGLSTEAQDLLLEAAPMHDIGKVGTPDGILLKPGKLTTDEFATMKRHAVIGYEILSSRKFKENQQDDGEKKELSPLLEAGAEIALSHHEKFDGSGYPQGKSGEDIPLFGRIVAVADVFDALTSERPYKKTWEIEKAKQFLREGAGAHFDPRCVEAFLSDWDEVLKIKNQFIDDQIELRDRNFE